MEGLRQDAAREGKTLSKFVAGAARLRYERPVPHGFFDLYGVCDDDIVAVEIRRRFLGNPTRLRKTL